MGRKGQSFIKPCSLSMHLSGTGASSVLSRKWKRIWFFLLLVFSKDANEESQMNYCLLCPQWPGHRLAFGSKKQVGEKKAEHQ